MLIKATAGGGGKGMRVAMNDVALQSGLKAAAIEAEKAFKNAGVYLEKYIDRPRHVEVQIIADNHGNAVHLWERDCTLQRRHQKLVEESPAPTLPQSVREDICKSAVRLVKAAGYTNAGTVEFIVDQADNSFYFIEVNARIQVEHPVTELVTGIDLIKSQIRIAAGEELPFKQKHIVHYRFGDRGPDQRRRPGPRISRFAGKDHQIAAAGRARRSFRLARLPGLHDRAVLRFDDRQADRVSADARRSHPLHATGPGGIRGRGGADDDSPACARFSTTRRS